MTDPKDPPSIEMTALEDDHTRSSYMQKLISSDLGTPELSADGLPPRILVQFWDDVNIPSDVRDCMASWDSFASQGFEQRLFNDRSAEQFITERFDKRYVTAFRLCKHPAMRSDYFRLCFVLKNGGFYVDADDVYTGGAYEDWFKDSRLRLQPLCYDIDAQSMVKITENVLKKRKTENLIFYANNLLLLLAIQ